MKKAPSQILQADLVLALGRYYNEGDGDYIVPVPPQVDSSNCHERLTKDQVNDAAALIIAFLGFPGGGDGKNFDLYRLLQNYLLYPNVRAQINQRLVRG